MMKLVNTVGNCSFIVIVIATIEDEQYSVGRFKFEGEEAFKYVRNKLVGDYSHPTDELFELMVEKFKYYDFIDDDAISKSTISFLFVDDVPEFDFTKYKD